MNNEIDQNYIDELNELEQQAGSALAGQVPDSRKSDLPPKKSKTKGGSKNSNTGSDIKKKSA